MSEHAVESLKSNLTKQKTAIGMVFVGIVATAAYLKQKQARKAAGS